jgi:hypothetical protein
MNRFKEGFTFGLGALVALLLFMILLTVFAALSAMSIRG